MSQDINLYEVRLAHREWLGARLLGQIALAVLALVAATALWAHFQSSSRVAVAAGTASPGQRTAGAGGRPYQGGRRAESVAGRGGGAVRCAGKPWRAHGGIQRVEFGTLAQHVRVPRASSRASRSSTGKSEVVADRVFGAARRRAIEIRGRALDAAALPAYVQGLRRRRRTFEGRRFAGLEISDRAFKENEIPGQMAAKPVGPAGAPSVAEPGVVEFVLRSEAAPEAGDGGIGGKRSTP